MIVGKTTTKIKERNQAKLLEFRFGSMLNHFVFKKPDYARARPSTILTDDDSYNKLYIENQDLDVFYRCAVLGKKVQKFKRTIQYTSAEKVIFYFTYYMALLQIV